MKDDNENIPTLSDDETDTMEEDVESLDEELDDPFNSDATDEEESEDDPEETGTDKDKKKNKKIFVGCLIALAAVIGLGAIINASNQPQPIDDKTTQTTTTKKSKSKSIGEKSDDSIKVIFSNKTSREIIDIRTKSSSRDYFTLNKLDDGDSIESNENCNLYASVDEGDNLALKIRFNGDSKSFTFENIETNDLKKIEIIPIDGSNIVLNIIGEDNNVCETLQPIDITQDDENEDESSGGNTSTTDDKDSNESDSTNQKEETSSSSSQHTHDWIPQYKTVHHDAIYNQVYVLDQAAYIEEKTICSVCGDDLTNKNVNKHEQKHIDDGDGSGTYIDYISVPEQGHYDKILVQDEYDEEVLTGYKCSTCGATE